MSTPKPQLLTYDQIEQRFDMTKYDPINNLDHHAIVFFEGDTIINGDLDKDWASAVLNELDADADVDSALIMVNGNLTVEGDIHIGDYHPLLLVIGSVTCDVLVSGDDTIHITGDAHIKYAFYGYYNDGSIIIEGTTYVPYVINSDHSSGINPEGAILINKYSDHHDFFDYDYLREVLPTVVIPEILDGKDEFDTWKFIEVVRSGKSPFIEGAKPAAQVYADELAGLISGNIEAVTVLDWSERNLKTFPLPMAKLKYLKKLDLSKNAFTEIPDAIGELENLEELYVQSGRITEISPAIGKLKKLRILNLGGNSQLQTLPQTIGDLQSLEVLKINYIPITFPDSMARLDKLEQIDMYQCYKEPPVSFPLVLTKLKNLKRLDLRANRLIQFPPEFMNLQTLEEFLWTDSSTQSTAGIDFTGFKNLKKLVISRKLDTWKGFVFNITTLEHLSIDRNKEEKQYISNDILDEWLKMAPEKGPEFTAMVQKIAAEKQEESDGRVFYISRPGMKPEDLNDIYKLKDLKILDLSFNGLATLPETFFQLSKLESMDLRYNQFSEDVRQRIKTTFPNAKIEW